ncbi:tetratricopeptide repeat protein [Bacteroides ovatus]|nr:tetratricopeptide repeat protein [Bacteroides ovatus]
MGYAQYFLNNYRESLDYFSKARELNPEDEYTLSIIRQCNMHLPLTRRVKEFWNWFVENEEKLSGMMNPKSMEEADAFMEFISKGTNLISEDMHFNIGGDHEFTFSVEGWYGSLHHLSLHHILYAGVSERQMEVLPLQPGQGRVFRIPCTRYRCRYGQDHGKSIL